MSQKFNILVTGSREFSDKGKVFAALDEVLSGVASQTSVTLIHGAARGADRLADEWAKSRGLTVEPYPALWEEHGKAAGGIRNSLMLTDGKPDLAVAFPTEKSIGTWDMVRKAKKAGIEVIVVK